MRRVFAHQKIECGEGRCTVSILHLEGGDDLIFGFRMTPRLEGRVRIWARGKRNSADH